MELLKLLGINRIPHKASEKVYDHIVANGITFKAGTALNNCSFLHCSLRGASVSQLLNERGQPLNPSSFIGSKLSQCDLRGAMLQSVVMAGVKMDGCDLSGSNISSSVFALATIDGVRFNGAIANGTSFVNARIRYADFKGADLRDTDWSGAIVNTDHDGFTNFMCANLCGARFKGAFLNAMDFRHIEALNCDFSDCDLRNADFRGARLHGSNFTNANLGGADFRGAYLDRCAVSGVNLDSMNWPSKFYDVKADTLISKAFNREGLL